jgi:hypothetical protein
MNEIELRQKLNLALKKDQEKVYVGTKILETLLNEMDEIRANVHNNISFDSKLKRLALIIGKILPDKEAIKELTEFVEAYTKEDREEKIPTSEIIGDTALDLIDFGIDDEDEDEDG